MAFGSILGQTVNALWPQIIVNAMDGVKVTITHNNKSEIYYPVNGYVIFNVPEYGLYTVEINKDNNIVTRQFNVDTVKQYKMGMVYGIHWGATSVTKWARTDFASGISAPNPAVNNGTGNSPFDNIMPWAGMIKEEQDGNILVRIPKFYYKWIKNGSQLDLKISSEPQQGFYVSPAHADREDGIGERDYVYIGRYHCNSNFKSQTGDKPIVNITGTEARQNITAQGAGYYKIDMALLATIRMLYLVEYADWNCQNTIGYGTGPADEGEIGVYNMGATDNMKYHTGTTAPNRTTYGSCQYRNIEGIWDNVYDYLDGMRTDNNSYYIVNNPNDFNNTQGGVKVTPEVSFLEGYPSIFNISENPGFEWFIYPTTLNGTDTTYCPDLYGVGYNAVDFAIGGFNKNNQTSFLGQNYGIFHIITRGPADKNNHIGCRLQKLL